MPVFDAQDADQDAEVDFANLERNFPTFEGEVPLGLCVAIGHSLSTYKGKAGDDGTKTNLATNVLFVIVFGTPY